MQEDLVPRTLEMSVFLVEDHGNGYMVLGTNRPKKARKALRDYVDDIDAYRFACPTHYEGVSSCWLSKHPGAVWEGATDHTGRPIAVGELGREG